MPLPALRKMVMAVGALRRRNGDNLIGLQQLTPAESMAFLTASLLSRRRLTARLGTRTIARRRLWRVAGILLEARFQFGNTSEELGDKRFELQNSFISGILADQT